ncbi:MAG TPA: hypothetical protein VMU48_21320 [Terracidiphilus sp.]|nr:hypothetical protein [Terracidiphilus sp.]
MASVAIFSFIAVLLAAAVLYLMRNQKVACWLLVPFPAFLCLAILRDLSGGIPKLGQSAFESDQKELLYCFFFLAMSLTAALRPRWPWLFWFAWVVNAFACALLVFLAYFWKAFS